MKWLPSTARSTQKYMLFSLTFFHNYKKDKEIFPHCFLKPVLAGFYLFCKKDFLINFACAGVSFLKKVETFLKGTPAQMFSCEFSKIFQRGFLIEHSWIATREHTPSSKKLCMIFYFSWMVEKNFTKVLITVFEVLHSSVRNIWV